MVCMENSSKRVGEKMSEAFASGNVDSMPDTVQEDIVTTA